MASFKIDINENIFFLFKTYGTYFQVVIICLAIPYKHINITKIILVKIRTWDVKDDKYFIKLQISLSKKIS